MSNSQHTDSSTPNPQTDILYSKLLKIVDEASDQTQLEEGFNEVAKLLLLQSNLIVANKAYQFLDIEFYFYNEKIHPDPYSHSFQYASSVRKKQSVTGSWYFHRFTGIDKYTHTRRGLDLTYGDGKKERYGGILIRAIKNLQDHRIISGPSKVVSEIILAANSPLNLERIAFDMSAGLAFNPKELLHISSLKTPRSITIFSSPRFGLSDKDHEYREKKYRFFVQKR
jgi:hypothetical protein